MPTAKLLQFQYAQGQNAGFYISGLTGSQGTGAISSAYDVGVIQLAPKGTPGKIQIGRVGLDLSFVTPSAAGLFANGPVYVRWAIIKGDVTPAFVPAATLAMPAGIPPFAQLGPGEFQVGSTGQTYEGAFLSPPPGLTLPLSVNGVLAEGVIAGGANVANSCEQTWADDPTDPSALISDVGQGIQLVVFAPIQPPAAAFAAMTNVVDVAIRVACGTPKTGSQGNIPLALPNSTLTVRN